MSATPVGGSAMSGDVVLTEVERDALADGCDAGWFAGATWVRFIRSGDEDMVIPVVERIVADRLAAERARWVEAIWSNLGGLGDTAPPREDVLTAERIIAAAHGGDA